MAHQDKAPSSAVLSPRWMDLTSGKPWKKRNTKIIVVVVIQTSYSNCMGYIVCKRQAGILQRQYTSPRIANEHDTD